MLQLAIVDEQRTCIREQMTSIFGKLDFRNGDFWHFRDIFSATVYSKNGYYIYNQWRQCGHKGGVARNK